MFGQKLEALIEQEYRDGRYTICGKQLGWRLFTSPIETIGRSPVAFIGLNPGGAADDPSHPRFAPVRHSAYVAESWAGYPPGESPLQRQVRTLFAGIGVKPDDTLSGNLVPFRSPNWQSLPNSERALTFGKNLWRQIFALSEPGLIVTIGRVPFDALGDILEFGPASKIHCGWGNVSLHTRIKGARRLVGLPHLSRFPIIDRWQSQTALAEAFGPWWQRVRCSMP